MVVLTEAVYVAGDTPLQDIRAAYGNLLSLPEDELWVADFICSLALFSKVRNQSRDTVMGCIIGPSSCGKTLALRPFLSWPGFTIPYEDQTENAANSGSPTITNTFLTDAHRRLVVCKEMTTIVGARPEKRHAFLSTLRGAADGSVSKRSGAMNKVRNTNTRFTFIGGGTDMMWDHMDEMKDLGHRFLFYQMWRARLNDRAFFRKLQFTAARASTDDHAKLIHEPLRRVVRTSFETLRKHYTPANPTSCIIAARQDGEHEKDFAARLDNFGVEGPTGWDKVDFPDVTRTEDQDWFFVNLSDLVTMARSGSYEEQDVNKKADMPMRVGNQLRDLASFRALCDLRVTTNEDDCRFARRLAQDTIDPTRFLITRLLYEAASREFGYTAEDIVRKTGRAEQKIRAILNHYDQCKFAIKKSEKVRLPNGYESQATRYVLSPEYVELVDQTKFFEGVA